MGLYSGGLIIGRIFASEIWWAYFREGLFLGGHYYRNVYGIFQLNLEARLFVNGFDFCPTFIPLVSNECRAKLKQKLDEVFKWFR